MTKKILLFLCCAVIWIYPATATSKSNITASSASSSFFASASSATSTSTATSPTATIKPTGPLFNQGLKALQENRPVRARALFLRFLKRHPHSTAGRFNLALTLHRQTKSPDPARAHLRQLLFENPYDKNTRAVLRSLKDRPYFWLWWPPDAFLAGMALSTLILITALFRKSFLNLKWILPIWLSAQGAGGFYFYHRLQRHGSLIQDTKALSAPDLKAPGLFTYPAGAMVKILRQSSRAKATRGKDGANLPAGWSQVRAKDGKTGWVTSHLLVPVNKKTK